MEMYEFGRRDLATDLLAARARGADVRLIVDRTVLVSARMADQLVAAGLPVRAYPVDDSRHQIDHVKLVLGDSQALVTGMNWGTTSARNHDYGLQTHTAAVVARLTSVFDHDWALSGGGVGGAVAPGGPAIETTPGTEVKQSLVAAINGSTHSIDAEIFTFTNWEVMAALGRACRRGVSVRVLMDPNQDVNRPGYQKLRQGGVQARWYPIPRGAKLHAKVGLFDGRLLLVGSANWSLAGLEINHELDLLTDDPAAVSAMHDRFERDWQLAG